MNTINETELMQMLEAQRDQITKVVRMTREPKRKGRPPIHSDETKQIARDIAAVLGATNTAAILDIPLPTMFRITGGMEKPTPTQISDFLKFVYNDNINQLMNHIRAYQS
ncbi:hypothetical protein [Aeromonas veronii]|uniref:hypothetical protein n=1 Tax=Aeromonas veronii TaxID=654 RepID=UPI003D1CEE61